tara:strand:+ start:69 stop:209 length:141 start_codon:yes stop_codon:yes gene_type:complete
MVGIVDKAVTPGGEDGLKIASYKNALVNFIKRTEIIFCRFQSLYVY